MAARGPAAWLRRGAEGARCSGRGFESRRGARRGTDPCVPETAVRSPHGGASAQGRPGAFSDLGGNLAVRACAREPKQCYCTAFHVAPMNYLFRFLCSDA